MVPSATATTQTSVSMVFHHSGERLETKAISRESGLHAISWSPSSEHAPSVSWRASPPAAGITKIRWRAPSSHPLPRW